MADILGLGVTHSPLLLGVDGRMAAILERVLQSPRLPDRMREPTAWPAPMQNEWAEHLAGRAAPAHRKRAVEAFRAARAALDAFNPDFILMFGDDQYENFREDGVAPFCVFATDEIESRPYARAGINNAWGEPADTVVKTKGHPAAGRFIAKALTEQGFDITWAYKMRHENGLPHAFMNALLLLDYDRKGLPWPVVPFHVNCYGSSTISKKGAFAHIDGTGEEEPDPPGPAPSRCFDIGAAVGRALAGSPWRVALIASSSWSHSFLTGKHDYLYPDLVSDRARFAEMREGNLSAWRNLSTAQIEDAGQQELLNWVCLAGAMDALGRKPQWVDMVETHIFVAPKVFAVFNPPLAQAAE
ncbi:MAG: extradiol ring-cleavage dioxygenase [Acetobacteraceae bacterium]|nr:extradiol ring-cleavage dioxygenase [Acetobacteraceae bacterium]